MPIRLVISYIYKLLPKINHNSEFCRLNSSSFGPSLRVARNWDTFIDSLTNRRDCGTFRTCLVLIFQSQTTIARTMCIERDLYRATSGCDKRRFRTNDTEFEMRKVMIFHYPPLSTLSTRTFVWIIALEPTGKRPSERLRVDWRRPKPVGFFRFERPTKILSLSERKMHKRHRFNSIDRPRERKKPRGNKIGRHAR